MKSTGFVRRLDGLGQIVLPSELRQDLDLKKRPCEDQPRRQAGHCPPRRPHLPAVGAPGLRRRERE